MSVNPFLSLDRQNFPAFSPMFKKKTPSSTEVKSVWNFSLYVCTRNCNSNREKAKGQLNDVKCRALCVSCFKSSVLFVSTTEFEFKFCCSVHHLGNSLFTINFVSLLSHFSAEEFKFQVVYWSDSKIGEFYDHIRSFHLSSQNSNVRQIMAIYGCKCVLVFCIF